MIPGAHALQFQAAVVAHQSIGGAPGQPVLVLEDEPDLLGLEPGLESVVRERLGLKRLSAFGVERCP